MEKFIFKAFLNIHVVVKSFIFDIYIQFFQKNLKINDNNKWKSSF